MVVRVAIVLSAAFAAFGCASGSGSSSAKPAADTWELAGSRIIACCCPSPCSCRLNKKPFHCHGCDFTNAVHVEKGTLGGVKMDGSTWVVVGRGFGEDKSKNWVYLYVSDTMSDEQVKALQGMFDASFKDWGPKAAHLAGKFEGMRKARIEYSVSADRRSWSCRIPGVLDLRNKAIVNPGRTEPVRSSGILDDFGDSFIHAETIAHTFKDGAHSWDLTGRQSNWADFHIGSHTTKKLGWGCWTAHAEYGDTSKYPEQQGGNDPEHK